MFIVAAVKPNKEIRTEITKHNRWFNQRCNCITNKDHSSTSRHFNNGNSPGFTLNNILTEGQKINAKSHLNRQFDEVI